ncbi:hypothetical protein NIES39_A00010 [Arthrospira platensis NIES-39]|nr:hypothetical protein NIES39_A00010 [Arthrospira platensis NIES-39]
MFDYSFGFPEAAIAFLGLFSEAAIAFFGLSLEELPGFLKLAFGFFLGFCQFRQQPPNIVSIGGHGGSSQVSQSSILATFHYAIAFW